jgi:hypothetical protein
MTTNKTLYEECIEASLKIDHHESDLYIKDCPEARALLIKHGKQIQTFIDNIDHEVWLDVPFEYPLEKKVKSRVGIEGSI